MVAQGPSTVYLGKDLLIEPEALELSIYREYKPYIVLSRRSSNTENFPMVSVSFDGQNKSEVFCGSSILAFQPGSMAPWKNVTISIGPLSFRIIFPNHHQSPSDPPYLQNLVQSASWFPPVGSKVGSRYPLLEPQLYHRDKILGQGGFGAVYKYIQYASGRTYAGKAIKPSRNDPKGHNTMEKVKKEFTYMSRDSVRCLSYFKRLVPTICTALHCRSTGYSTRWLWVSCYTYADVSSW